MKYTLKAPEFTTVLTMLAGMVQLESNMDHLDVIYQNIFKKKAILSDFFLMQSRFNLNFTSRSVDSYQDIYASAGTMQSISYQL